MQRIRNYITSLTLVMIFVFSVGSVYGEEMSAGGTAESSLILYFHFAQVIVAILVAKFVIDVIQATGQKDIFIFIPIAMGIYVLSAIVQYLPHLSIFSEADAELYSVILNSLANVSLGTSFYKWRKMLKST